MKSLAAEVGESSRSLSVPDAGGCDITKLNPADSRLDSVLDRMRMDWHETARYKITLSKDGEDVDGKSILGLLLLAAGKGTPIVVRTEGVDEAEAMVALTDLVDRRFDESE